MYGLQTILVVHVRLGVEGNCHDVEFLRFRELLVELLHDGNRVGVEVETEQSLVEEVLDALVVRLRVIACNGTF